MMFINENCVKCLYDRQAAITEDKDYLAEIRTILENRGETDTAPYMVYLFNQVYEKRFGKKYSYEKEKKECNDLLLSMQEEIRGQIRQSEENYRELHPSVKAASPYGSVEKLRATAASFRDEPVSLIVMDCMGFTAELGQLAAEESGKIILVPRVVIPKIIRSMVEQK